MSAKKNVHVVKHDDGWAVKKAGNERASSVHQTQQQAIDAGREAAKAERSELVIHGRDGRIRDADSYGGDPNPPRDAKH
jgi:hypothetical protein